MVDMRCEDCPRFNPDEGVCIRFAEPVRGMDPMGKIRHPGLTVTVAEPLMAGEPTVGETDPAVPAALMEEHAPLEERAPVEGDGFEPSKA